MKIYRPYLVCAATFMLLSFGPASVVSPMLSPNDQQTLAEIHELIGWIKEDCKKMSLADFQLQNDPEYLREISHQLALECISGN